MSESNVELARRAIETYNAHDVEQAIALCDPRIEVHAEFDPDSLVYHGHDGVRTLFRVLADVWGDELRVEPEAYFDLGKHTLTFEVLHARGRQSGAEVAMPAAQVFRWHDGLAIRWTAYAHREDALRDLGVNEDELEPIAP
jgi:ketosteroid isomerase-like protein